MIAFIICYWSAMSNQFKREALMLLLIFSPKPDINLSICQLFNIFKKNCHVTYHGLMLFTIKRANAIQTLLEMTAASASLPTMAKTRHRKKPWIAKISSSCQPRRRINTWGTSTCPGTTSAIMWWLWPHMKRSTKPSWPTATQQHSFTTSATMTS